MNAADIGLIIFAFVYIYAFVGVRERFILTSLPPGVATRAGGRADFAGSLVFFFSLSLFSLENLSIRHG